MFMSTLEGQNKAENLKAQGYEAPTETNQAGPSMEDPFAVGRERIAKINLGIDSVKQKAKTWFTNVSNKISGFWNKTKSVGGEVIPAVLSADVLAEKGLKNVADRVEAFDEKTDKQAYEAGVSLGKNLAEGYDIAKEKVVGFGQDVEEVGSSISEDYVSAFKDLKEGTIFAAKWTEDKADKMLDFISKKEDLLADKLILAGEKTHERFIRFGNGVTEQYKNIKNFGEKSFMSAKMKIAEIKQKYRDEQNRKAEEKQRLAFEAKLAQIQAEIGDHNDAQKAALEAYNYHKIRQEKLNNLLQELNSYQTAA